MNYLPVLLTAVGDSKNLFNEAWTEGNLYSIQSVVEVLGNFSCKVISIVGFGIVIFSILKNALSGLYVVNPNFWDKVDDLKNQAVALAVDGVNTGLNAVGNRTQQIGGNVAAAKLGSIFTFILSAIPNVKALTDFDDGVPVDKKQYFMKSIPLLIIQIFIGMLIFFGYPAKIANWIGSGATYAISAIINNVDPIETVNKVSQNLTVYNLATDGSQDRFEQVVNMASQEMMSTVKTRYTDMKKNPAQETAYALENALLTALDVDVIRNIIGATEGYDVSVVTTAREQLPTVSGNYKNVSGSGAQEGPYMAQATNGTVSFVYWVQGNVLPTGSTMVGSTDFFVWRITATPMAVSNTSSANLIVFAGISLSANDTKSNASTGLVSMQINGITVGDGANDIRGSLGRSVTVDIIDKDGGVHQSLPAVIQTASISQTSGAVPILSLSRDDAATIVKELPNNNYLRVNLTGSWSKDVKSGGSKQVSTTVRVTELRLVGNSTSSSYALSTWPDVDMSTNAGTSIDATDFLTRGKLGK